MRESSITSKYLLFIQHKKLAPYNFVVNSSQNEFYRLHNLDFVKINDGMK